MYKKIIVIASAIGITSILGTGLYYIGVHLPQKQKAIMEAEKADMEIVKLELEAKIEQEKTEQARIEQEKKQAEEDKEKKLAEEEAAVKKASALSAQAAENKKKIQIQQCLDRVEDWYSDAASDITYSSNAMDILNSLGDRRNQLRNECYK